MKEFVHRASLLIHPSKPISKEDGMMKKVLGVVLVAFMLGVFTGGQAFAQAKAIEWKMISTWTPAINLIEADRYFVKLVNELSGGRFKITLHPAPELVPPNQVFDSISKGQFPIGGE
jgi:TRAP-type mannitol/chloroaromatic compound transport system substrate-binding protein